MEISVRSQDGIGIIELSGEVDLYNAPAIKENIKKLAEAGTTKVVIEMGKVTYIDSSGIGALISSLSMLKKSGGKLRIAGVHGPVLKVFELTKLTSFFEISDSLPSALSGF